MEKVSIKAGFFKIIGQSVFTYLKLTIETLEQGVKYFPI